MNGFTNDDALRIQAIARPVLLAKAHENPDMTDQVDDICQQVVMNVGKNIVSGTTIDKFDAYVKEVARNEFTRAQKKLIKQRKLDLATAHVAEHPGDPDAVVDRTRLSVTSEVGAGAARSLARLQISRVRRTSGPLNENERNVLELQMKGRTAAEIAEELDLAGSHVVDTIAYRARRKARRSLRTSSPAGSRHVHRTPGRFRG